MNIHIINGPNLNLLGRREPDVYGRQTLQDIESELTAAFREVSLEFFQSNHEGALIDALHRASEARANGIVFNPGAYTHTSIALRDAISAIDVPVIEVHLSNVYAREDFRHKSLLSAVCVGQISGLGPIGYRLAISFLADRPVHEDSQSARLRLS